MAELCMIEFLLTDCQISLARAYPSDASIGGQRAAHFGNDSHWRSVPTAGGLARSEVGNGRLPTFAYRIANEE